MLQTRQPLAYPRVGGLKNRLLAGAEPSMPCSQSPETAKSNQKCKRSIPLCLTIALAFLIITAVSSLQHISSLLHTASLPHDTLDSKRTSQNIAKNARIVNSDVEKEKSHGSLADLHHDRTATEEPSCATAHTILPLLELDSISPLALRSYAAMHAEKRACLEAQNCAELPNVLVWHCVARVCGGIGDRMRGIRLMFLMAVATRRLFFISWPRTATGPFSLTAVLLPVAIDWRLPKKMLQTYQALPTAAMSFSETYLEAVWTIGNDRKHSNISIDFNKTDFAELMRPSKVILASNRVRRYLLITLTGNMYARSTLKGLQRAHNDLATLEQRVTRLLFRPTPTVQTAVAARTFANGVPYAAVHARTGDDTKETNLTRLRYVSSHLSEAAQRLLSCALSLHKDASRRIYLAADSRRFKLIFIDLARQHGIEVRTDLRPVLHVDRNVTGKYFQDRNALCDAFIDVFADMVTLANASAFVFLRSGFAATAVSLSTSHIWRELSIDDFHTQENC